MPKKTPERKQENPTLALAPLGAAEPEPPDYEPALVAKARRYAVNGKTVLKKDKRCSAIINCLLGGMARIQIKHTFHVGLETIDAIAQIYEANGKLRPIKELLTKKWLEVAQLCTERIRDAILAGQFPVTQLPTCAGIATDKYLLLTGNATEIIGHKKFEPELEAVLLAFGRPKQVRCDGPSQLNQPKPLQIEAKVSHDTAFDTKPETRGAGGIVAPGGPREPGSSERQNPASKKRVFEGKGSPSKKGTA